MEALLTFPNGAAFLCDECNEKREAHAAEVRKRKDENEYAKLTLGELKKPTEHLPDEMPVLHLGMALTKGSLQATLCCWLTQIGSLVLIQPCHRNQFR